VKDLVAIARFFDDGFDKVAFPVGGEGIRGDAPPESCCVVGVAGVMGFNQAHLDLPCLDFPRMLSQGDLGGGYHRCLEPPRLLACSTFPGLPTHKGLRARVGWEQSRAAEEISVAPVEMRGGLFTVSIL